MKSVSVRHLTACNNISQHIIKSFIYNKDLLSSYLPSEPIPDDSPLPSLQQYHHPSNFLHPSPNTPTAPNLAVSLQRQKDDTIQISVIVRALHRSILITVTKHHCILYMAARVNHSTEWNILHFKKQRNSMKS